jgi:hypothetical protein
VPGEYKNSTMELAESLGPILGKNRGNPQSIDQKFYVTLTASSPFILQIEVVNPVNGKVSQIAVDYNNLPIRCCYCMATTRLVWECPTLEGKNVGNRKESLREGTGRDHEIAKEAEKETEGVGIKTTMETGISLGDKGDEVRETLKQSKVGQGATIVRNKDLTANQAGATKEKQVAGGRRKLENPLQVTRQAQNRWIKEATQVKDQTQALEGLGTRSSEAKVDGGQIMGLFKDGHPGWKGFLKV